MIWYEVSPSITCKRVRVLISPTFKSKDTCPKVYCCDAPLLDTWSSSQMIFSDKIPKASSIGKGKILVEALVSTKALLI